MANTLWHRTDKIQALSSLLISVTIFISRCKDVLGLHSNVERMQQARLSHEDSSLDREDYYSLAVATSGRSLLQFSNQSASNDSSIDELVCCCPVGGGQYRSFDYEYPAPSASCCCNSTDICTLCSQSESFNSVCGSGQVCGILLLMATLIGTLAVTICVTGVFLARRRRQRNATLDQFVSPSTTPGGQPVQRTQMLHISEDQLKELYIAQVPEGEHGGEIKECPICLDSVPVENGIWSRFPCGHGSCTMCVNDLLRHSSRRVNATTAAVLCPLCRTLAVAPIEEGNEPCVRVQDVDDDIEQQRNSSNSMQNEEDSHPLQQRHENSMVEDDVAEDVEQLGNNPAETISVVTFDSSQRHS